MIAIKSTGVASGTIKYGRLSMEEGGELTAQVRNIPPSIGGDLDLTVSKGRSVRITLADLNALDPDDKAEDLTFEISNAANGFVALGTRSKEPVNSFSQADLESGRVYFAHDGSDAGDGEIRRDGHRSLWRLIGPGENCQRRRAGVMPRLSRSVRRLGTVGRGLYSGGLMANLFEAAGLEKGAPRPLADRLRPKSLAEVDGPGPHRRSRRNADADAEKRPRA